MSKKVKIIIGITVAAIIVIGGGLLHWGSLIYWNSDGERGWSLGASVYEFLGWDARAYKSDMGWKRVDDVEGARWTDRLEVRLVDDDKDGTPDRGVVETPAESTLGRDFSDRHSFFGRVRDSRFGEHRHSPFGILAGLTCLGFFGLLGGLAILFLYRQSHKAHSQTVTE